jgi:hypothetical protein
MPNFPKVRETSSEAPLPSAVHLPSSTDSTQEWQGQSEKVVSLERGRSLFQDSFFFCRIKPVGDLPGLGDIYVEAVVDAETGLSFAKVYTSRNAMNAVDILATRVVPFFNLQGTRIAEIHTRNTSEYCGLLPKHPYETYLATSHIQHRFTDLGSHYGYNSCGQFYSFLHERFFQPALRGKFEMSLSELQRDLDTFIDDCNAETIRRTSKMWKIASP